MERYLRNQKIEKLNSITPGNHALAKSVYQILLFQAIIFSNWIYHSPPNKQSGIMKKQVKNIPTLDHYKEED
jgi:hypothetical protein